MNTILHEKAWAKLNIFLDAAERREDALRIRAAARAALIQLPEQLRRGDGEIRLADDEFTGGHIRQGFELFAPPGGESRAAAHTEGNVGADLGGESLQRLGREGPVMAVQRPQHRRRGIADSLMNTLTDECDRRRIERILLEVRQSNAPARALYKKHGFTVLGVRAKYYDEPKEDAVIMERERQNQ